MAHEIYENDQIVLHQKKAWHGLGIVLNEAPSPSEALRTIGADWQVVTLDISAHNGDGLLPCKKHKAIVRSDNNDVLNVMGHGYIPIQNEQVADFAVGLAMAGDDVKCESAGTLCGGRKLWFLLKGESFSLRGDDVVENYVMVANAHDGSMAFTALNTSVRVVCANTLSMAIGGAKSAFRIRHTGDSLQSRVEQAREILGLYQIGVRQHQQQATGLASRDVNQSALQSFWTGVYERQFGNIPANPANEKDVVLRDKATVAMGKIMARFDLEAKDFGATRWTMLNAYTHWLQHGRFARASADAHAGRVLFGVDGARSSEAFEMAMSL